MRTFTAVYFELNGYINMSFRRSKASSGLKYIFFFSFITVTSANLFQFVSGIARGILWPTADQNCRLQVIVKHQRWREFCCCGNLDEVAEIPTHGF